MERAPIDNSRLLLVSAASLFAEVMLIRWIGTEVRIFAFFQNLALIGCFLGFGLGCYRTGERSTLLPSLTALTVLVVLVAFPLPFWRMVLISISDLLGLYPDAALWGGGANVFETERIGAFILAGAIVSFFIILLMMVMVPFGQWVAHYMDSSPHVLRAYSLNLVGSTMGIWLMAAVSFLHLPPPVWFGTIVVLALLCTPVSPRVVLIAGGLVAIMFAFLYIDSRNGKENLWSPYQKIQVKQKGEQNYDLEVNNSTYMSIANRTSQFLAKHPDFADQHKTNSYDSAFQFAAAKERILIVGSGAGNDVAAALRNGVQSVDAVEIDPVIYAVGQRLHPEHPYDSPKVHLIINDARNFIRESKDKYDVIVFALLDSHTGFSSYSNMRVDNYVYTEESFRSAQKLLKPDGIMVLKFEVRPPWTWMGQRFYAMFNHLFGRAPVAYFSPASGMLASASVFIASNSPNLWERAQGPELREFLARHPVRFAATTAGAPPATTDDWPFVYHRGRSIPRTYLTVTLILFGLAFLSVRDVFQPKQVSAWHFLLLGAGFLLLETQLINRLALYFGSTWLVNCIALTALLCVLVLSNIFVERASPGALGKYYVMLLGALIAIYLFPWSRLPYSSHVVGILLSAGFCLPVFFAGVIFAETFRRTESKSQALGSNVFGAVIGGLLQNLSFLVGIKALMLVAAAIYAGARICHRMEQSGRLLSSGIDGSVTVYRME